jgi:hypothetical protein
MENTQLDQDAVNLAKAIRQHESGGDFNAQGKSGESGAYQFTAPTWRGYAKEVLGDENAEMTPQNQNKVAYTKIKQWKDKGLNVGQIASSWNAGEGRPNAYKENNVGVNEFGVHYDTPTYARKVAEIYQQTKGQTPKVTQPQKQLTPLETPQPEEPTLKEDLVVRGEQFRTGLSSLVGGKQQTDQTRISGAIQTVGAVAGGLGDVINKILEKTPIVGTVLKGLEDIIGEGAQAFFQTETGQNVAKSLGEFSEKHSELSKDIGAGINILTAIPILKGIGVAKNVVMDASASALKGVAEKAITKDLTEVASRTIGGKTAISKNPNIIKTLVDERALPEISNGKLSMKEAYNKLGETISDIEDNTYQPILKSLSTRGVDTRRPLEELRQQALKEAKTELRATGQVSKAESEINRVFDDYKNSYGDYVTLEDINDMKRGIRKSVNFNSPKLESDVTYHIGQVFQKDIENSAIRLNLPDVNKINQRMGDLIKAQNLLKYLENKPIKTGFVGGLIKNTATVAGEGLGNVTGIPFAGALVGRGIGGNIGKKLTGGIEGILKRTGKDAKRVSREELKKKLGGLLGGAVTQKIMNQ